MKLENYIRTVEDFPKPGISFKDITPLLGDYEAMAHAVKELAKLYSDKQVDKIGAFDARGFLFGPMIAQELKIPFFPIRKAGKLPYETIGESYGLEYGTDEVEIQIDAVKPGDNVLLMDDLLATGGTMRAGCNLVEKLGGIVSGCEFLIELDGLGGREKLEGYDVRSLLRY